LPRFALSGVIIRQLWEKNAALRAFAHAALAVD
jgi:hypothetical protein